MEQYDQQKGGVRVLPATSQLLLVVVCVCVRSSRSSYLWSELDANAKLVT